MREREKDKRERGRGEKSQREKRDRVRREERERVMAMMMSAAMMMMMRMMTPTPYHPRGGLMVLPGIPLHPAALCRCFLALTLCPPAVRRQVLLPVASRTRVQVRVRARDAYLRFGSSN